MTSNGDRPSTLSSRLRDLRGLSTQSELSRNLRISPSLMSSWENGSALPTTDRLSQYAHYFRPDDVETLLEELLRLRQAQLAPQVPREPSALDVLKDIRWLLQEIRDRLPPRQEPG